MQPLWIINLNQSTQDNQGLQQLLQACDVSIHKYWYYSSWSDQYTALSSEDKVHDVDSLDFYRAALNWITSEGQACVNRLRAQGLKFTNLQVCVLGNAVEEQSQQLFHLLPALLQCRRARISSDHANRGLELYGFLFLPETVNQIEDRTLRTRCAILLEELNTLTDAEACYRILTIYQENQYSSTRFYEQLNSSDRSELLLQYLVATYCHDDMQPNRIIRQSSSKPLMLSVGAASVYYHSELHRRASTDELWQHLSTAATDEKSMSGDDSEALLLHLRNHIDPDRLHKELQTDCHDIADAAGHIMQECSPHPIRDLLNPKLWPQYFHKQLRFMPAQLLENAQLTEFMLTQKFGHVIESNANRFVEQAAGLISETTYDILAAQLTTHPTLSQQQHFLSLLTERIHNNETSVRDVKPDIIKIPARHQGLYEQCRNGEPEMEQQRIVRDLAEELKNEPTFLGSLSRSLLLGIALCLLGLPLLRWLSPRFVDLGVLSDLPWLWGPILLLIPFVVHIGFTVRMHHKRVRQYKQRMLIRTLYNAEQKLSTFYAEQASAAYSRIADLCSKLTERNSELKEFLGRRAEAASTTKTDSTTPMPHTRFNQPLIGGAFCKIPVFDNNSPAQAAILTSEGERVRVSDFTTTETRRILRKVFACGSCRDWFHAEKDAERTPIDTFAHEADTLLQGLLCNTAANIADFCAQYADHIDLMPLFRMSSINGMMISNLHNTKLQLFVSANSTAPLLKNNCAAFQRQTDIQSSVETVATGDELLDSHLLALATAPCDPIDGNTRCHTRIEEADLVRWADLLTHHFASSARPHAIASHLLSLSEEQRTLIDQLLNATTN